MNLNAYLPPYFHLWHLPVVFFAGLIGEGYATIIGSGGVLIQFVLTALGMPLANVIATDLAGCMGADIGIINAVISFELVKKKQKLFLLLALPLFLGGMVGTFGLMFVDATILKYVLIAGLSLLLIHVLIGKQPTMRSVEELHIDVRHYPVIFLLLFVLGIYGNISGVGSGTFMKLVFISILHIKMTEAMGMGSIITLPASLFSLIATATAGLIVWPYCITLWAGTYVGAKYMANVARKVPNRYLQALLVGVVSLYLAWLIFSLVQ